MPPDAAPNPELLNPVQVMLPFPAVLDQLGLKAFDMCKLVDSFVRAESGLLKEVRKHLFSVQERILDFLAWQRGSSLYTIMKLACQAPSQVTGSHRKHRGLRRTAHPV